MRRIGKVFMFDAESELINEQSTPIVEVELKDQDGNAINTLSELELTYYDKKSGDIINGREAMNVLNQDGITFSQGLIRWRLSIEDTSIQGQVSEFDSEQPSERWKEVHTALFKYKFNSGIDQDWIQVQLQIINLEKVG
jgi:hypothetical protein